MPTHGIGNEVSVLPDPQVPALSRVKFASDGYGPIVSLGVTTQVAFVDGGGVVVVVVVVVVVAVFVGLVGVSPPQAAENTAPAAPSMPSASRRLTCLRSIRVPQ